MICRYHLNLVTFMSYLEIDPEQLPPLDEHGIPKYKVSKPKKKNRNDIESFKIFQNCLWQFLGEKAWT